MIAGRLGCQVCFLVCALQAASLQHGAKVAQSWPVVILGDVMASVLQLVHPPIGLQVCHANCLIASEVHKREFTVYS